MDVDVFCILVLLCFTRRYKSVRIFQQRLQLAIYAYTNIQHHERLIVTTIARCFSLLTAKCDGVLCKNGPENSYTLRHAFFGNSNQLQRRVKVSVALTSAKVIELAGLLTDVE